MFQCLALGRKLLCTLNKKGYFESDQSERRSTEECQEDRLVDSVQFLFQRQCLEGPQDACLLQKMKAEVDDSPIATTSLKIEAKRRNYELVNANVITAMF